MNRYGVPTVGLTSIGWVRVEISPEGPLCQVVGTNRRRLVVHRVPLATATALIAGGVPSVVRHSPGSRPLPVHT